MAIWHPSLTYYEDTCTGMWWAGLLVNPTGLYPSLSTPGQLDGGCYWYDPKLVTPCWASAFYQCRSCCCKPQRCGIPDEVSLTISGFTGTLTSIDYSSDYGYSPSVIQDCSQFYQKNCDTTRYGYFHDCYVLPAHTAIPCWHTSGNCCGRETDTFFWWPRDSFRGTEESTGGDLCNRTRAICFRWPNLCSSTGHSGPTYVGIDPPRWIPTCESCCGWGWFFWGDEENKQDKQTVIGAADCPYAQTGGYNYRQWYNLYWEFKYETEDGEEIDTTRWGIQDPILVHGFSTYLWPPGWRGLSSRNLLPLAGAFWNSWHLDFLGHSRSPYYEACVGGYWPRQWFSSFPDPRDGWSDWCDNITQTWYQNPYWLYKRPQIVLISQPSAANCHYCWSGVTNLLNYSSDGHCNGTCNVNMADFNNTLIARSAVYLRPPNFNLRLLGRNRPFGSLDTHFLYMVNNPDTPWSYKIDYPCHPKVFSPACGCMVCDISPGIAQPRLAPFYSDLTGYGAKIGFDMRIYCAPTYTPRDFEAGKIWNGGWWYIDDVWIEQPTDDEPNPGGVGYQVGDRFYFDYYESPRRGGELYWPTERERIFFQEARVAEVGPVGQIKKIELVQHVPRWGQANLDEYPEDVDTDEPMFAPGGGQGANSNTVTKILGFGAAVNQPPSAPQNFSGDAAPNAITLSWEAPSSDGGSAITSYLVSYTNSSTGVTTTIGVGSRTDYTLYNMTPGIAYSVSVAARNAVGNGDYTATVSVTPLDSETDPPGSPTNLVATPISFGAARLEWDAPDEDGGTPVTGYRIVIDPLFPQSGSGLEESRELLTTDTHIDLSGFETWYISYRATVYALNDAGASDASESVSFYPWTSPFTSGEKQEKDLPVLEEILPVITLNASNHAPVYGAGSAYAIVDPDIEIIGSDYLQVTGAQITIDETNRRSGDELFMSEGWTAGTRKVQAQYDASTGTLNLFQVATREEYELALQAVHYRYNGQDPTDDGTRSNITIRVVAQAIDLSARTADLSPIILNLGCGRFFRQFRPPLYGRILNHRYAVAVPGTNYYEGDVIQWDAEMNPPSGTINAGYKFNPYWNVTTTPRRYARATVAEVDSRGGVVDWYMCGAVNQFTHPVTGAYNPSENAPGGFWPSVTFDWYPSEYDFYYCSDGINRQGDYYDIAYANRCDYCYTGYLPLRYSWSGIGHVLSKNFNGHCDHTWAQFNYRIEQISVKTDIDVAEPIQPWGRKAKLRLIDVNEDQDFYGCNITPVAWINGEEAPGWGANVYGVMDDGCLRFYKRHKIPVKQGSITDARFIQIVDSGSGYVYDNGANPAMTTYNGAITLVNVNDDLRNYLAAIYGFEARAHFRVSSFTADGGINGIELIPGYPGYFYFVQQDSSEVWFETISTDWYFEMAWPSDARDPIHEDPSPDCRVELSYQFPCCHATRDNWGYLSHYDGFPEPWQTSMGNYERIISVFNPDLDAMWYGENDYVNVKYQWSECAYGPGGWPYGTKPSITGEPGTGIAGDQTKRWSTGTCPNLHNKVYRMILVHPCAACAWEQGLPGGQGCISSCGYHQTTYSPTMMEPAFVGGGAGPQWSGGSGQAWITGFGGSQLQIRINPLYGSPPAAGEEGDI